MRGKENPTGWRWLRLTPIVLLAAATAVSAQNVQGGPCEQTLIREIKSLNERRAANTRQLSKDLSACKGNPGCRDDVLEAARKIDRALRKQQIDFEFDRDACKSEWFLMHAPPAPPCDKRYREQIQDLNLQRTQIRGDTRKRLIDYEDGPGYADRSRELHGREERRLAEIDEAERGFTRDRNDCRSAQVPKK